MTTSTPAQPKKKSWFELGEFIGRILFDLYALSNKQPPSSCLTNSINISNSFPAPYVPVIVILPMTYFSWT